MLFYSSFLKDNLKAAQANNNFYADAGVNFGYTKSSSKINSHNESVVVTTIRGKDENSSITYNNVKNVEYVGTQAQDTKFIYNNVENINKRAVELKNSYSSSSTSSGISAGVTINYNNGFQAEVDTIRVSASKSKMNTNATNFQNELLIKESVEGTVKYEIVKKVVKTGSKTLATGALFFLHSTPAGGSELLPNEIKTKSDPRKIIIPATYGYLAKHFPEYIEAKGNEYTLKGNYKDGMLPPKNQGEKINKVIFEDIKNFYDGTKTLDEKISESNGKFYGSLIGSTSGVIATSYGINKAKSIVNSLNGVDKLGTIEASSNKIVEPQKYSLSNVEARKWYLEQEAKIPDMIDSSLSLEEQAKQAFNLRNKFRTEARELMADRATAESLYKTDPNWSWEKIVQKQVEKGLSGDDIYKEIIASSQRSRDAVNKSLGVK